MRRSFLKSGALILIFMMLLFGAASAGDTPSPECTVLSPTNTTLSNASGVDFWILCGNNVISNNVTTNTSYINGTTKLNTTMEMRGLNTSARNLSYGSGRHAAISDGNYFTTYFYSTDEGAPENISVRWMLDTTAPSTINISSPTARNYSSLSQTLTCLSNEAGTMTATTLGRGTTGWFPSQNSLPVVAFPAIRWLNRRRNSSS